MVGEQRQVVFSVVEAGLAVWNGVCQGGRVGGPVTDGRLASKSESPIPGRWRLSSRSDPR